MIHRRGGTLYRLVFLETPDDLKAESLGQHWVMDPYQIYQFIEGGDFRLNGEHRNLHEYLIVAKVKAGAISIPATIGDYWNEQEVYLKNPSDAIVDYTLKEYK